jgi:UDP-GlcNAc:undecaprenyl-phosphate GlcNAc-1-phosphate transferase
MIALCLLLAGVSFVISLPLTRLLIGLGHRRGLVDAPDAAGSGGRKDHARPIPNTGGVAIFLAIALPIAAVLAAVWVVPESSWTGPLAPVAPHVEGLRSQTRLGVGILAALAAIHVLGLIDDRRRLGPYSKLLVQLAVALGLVLICRLRVLEFLGKNYGLAGEAVSIVLSVAWIVVVTNAMNFLDNMDGLAAGVGAICAALYLAATLIGGQWFVAGAAALLVGSLAGFLVFNFPPARVFMGDGGSLVVGLMLAVISIRTTYFAPGSPHAPGAWYGVLMPLMVLAIPLYDFTSVTLIRLAHGQSPFRGDQNHFSHRLVRKGLGKRAAVLTIWLCTLATGIGGVMLGSLGGWQAALAAGQSAAVVLLLAVLERGKSG